MKRPEQKRQIIKTRSQRPYIVARVVIAFLVVLVLLALAVAFERRQHSQHAAALGATLRLAGPAFFRPESGEVSAQ